MISFIGNCSNVINWTDVINGLERCDYERHPGPDNGPTHKEGDPIPLLHQVTDIWRDEGYKIVELGGTVQWDMFFPGKHYDRIVEEKFCDFFEIQPKAPIKFCERCFSLSLLWSSTSRFTLNIGRTLSPL